MTTYNGWSNYETWCVNLWLDNEEGTQSHWAEVAQEALDEAKGDADAAALSVAKRLQDEIEDDNPLAGQGTMYYDLLSAALQAVNWREVALEQLDGLTYEADED